MRLILQNRVLMKLWIVKSELNITKQSVTKSNCRKISRDIGSMSRNIGLCHVTLGPRCLLPPNLDCWFLVIKALLNCKKKAQLNCSVIRLSTRGEKNSNEYKKRYKLSSFRRFDNCYLVKGVHDC